MSRYWFRATCTKLSRSNKFRNCCKVISVHMNSPSQLSEYSTVDCNRLDMLDSLAIVVIPRKQFHLLIATNQSQEIPRSWKITRWTRYFENLKISNPNIIFRCKSTPMYPPTNYTDTIVTNYLERVMKSLMNFIKFYLFTLYHSIKKNLILLMIQWIIDVLITIVVTSLDVINFFRYFIT